MIFPILVCRWEKRQKTKPNDEKRANPTLGITMIPKINIYKLKKFMIEGSKVFMKPKGKNINPSNIEGIHHSIRQSREQPLHFRKWR